MARQTKKQLRADLDAALEKIEALKTEGRQLSQDVGRLKALERRVKVALEEPTPSAWTAFTVGASGGQSPIIYPNVSAAPPIQTWKFV